MVDDGRHYADIETDTEDQTMTKAEYIEYRLTPRQINILAALRGMITTGRRWLPFTTLAAYDGRSVMPLIARGLIEVNPDYGVRVTKREG